MKESLKSVLQSDLREYQGIPFWSWNNYLDRDELIKQIEDMNDSGIGGFIIHARTGLKDEYLGEKWFACVEACLKRAKELNMQAWIYDENGWPSGFVGGKLLEVERFRARFLEYSVGEYDAEAFAVFVEDTEKGFVRVKQKLAGKRKYHNIYLRISPANTDILNPEVTDAFIKETHEKYYARFAERFGKELVGFFTDEPQYYRWATPYTHCIEPEFDKLGQDVRDGLIWLFVQDERGYAFRTSYYQTLNRLYTENFYKKIYEWCNTHGCQLTGHSIEEGSLIGQMLGGAGVMPSYEYEHMPAVDWLGRTCGTELSPKQAGSVASQLSKRFVLSEMFACSGYDATSKELKSIAEFQYFHGVSKTCHHLYPYSIANRGRIDHPPVFGKRFNWGDGFSVFNTYFNRLSYIVVNTEEDVDVAILHPMRDIYLEYLHNDYESIKEIEQAFDELLSEFRKRGITYHLIDEYILNRHGKIEDDCLKVGNRRYNKILIPKRKQISVESYALLKEYRGLLCLPFGVPDFVDGKPEEVCLVENYGIDELYADATVKFWCEDGNSVLSSRSGEIGEFIFIKNLSPLQASVVQLQSVAERYRALDLETLQEKNISNLIQIEAGGSVILIEDDDAVSSHYEYNKIDVTHQFKITDITKNYLVLDTAQIKKAEGEYCPNFPIVGLQHRLLEEDYKGEVTLRQTFNLNGLMPLTLIMEKAAYKSITVNGKPVTFTQSAFDVNYIEFDISDLIKIGENELIYSIDFWQHEGVHFALFDPLATESLRNCLYYDTSLETVYLKGDFIVEKDMSLKKRNTLPELTKDLYKKGYPFFKGVLTLNGSMVYDGQGRVTLGIDGRFLLAEITINDKERLFVLDDKGDITDLLQVGENQVEIKLRSSFRNLYGPHHFKSDADPTYICPDHFDFRGCWNGTVLPDNYTEKYNVLPFGAEKIYIYIENILIGKENAG